MDFLKKLFNGQALTFEQFTEALGAAKKERSQNFSLSVYIFRFLAGINFPAAHPSIAYNHTRALIASILSVFSH